ncbi:MAG: hypothetical protein JO092_04800 [Candidatus Eremiobacteraeota bacterium]|nr:hypothetical protein [Candidatus Eremiobacteraeota bacterium]
MSDISLQFPWWFDLLLLIATVFWPLTAAAVAAGIWLWLQRSRRAVRILTIPVLVLWAISAGVNLYGWIDNQRSRAHDAAELRSRQRTLTEPTRIAGITLPPKTVVTRGYGKGLDNIQTLDLPKPADVHGIPLIGHVEFDEAGKIHGTVTLARDAPIGGIPCSAKADAMVLNGRLSSCTLAQPHVVAGIPCLGKLDVTVGVSCTLAARYERFGVVWPPQTFVSDSPAQGKTWFTIGPAAPSLRILGTALPEKSDVEYVHSQLSSINLGTRLVHFGGNPINVIDVRGNAVLGEIARADFDEPLRRVALPASAIQLR